MTMPAMAPALMPEFEEEVIGSLLASAVSLGARVTVWTPPVLVMTETMGVVVEAVSSSVDFGVVWSGH